MEETRGMRSVAVECSHTEDKKERSVVFVNNHYGEYEMNEESETC